MTNLKKTGVIMITKNSMIKILTLDTTITIEITVITIIITTTKIIVPIKIILTIAEYRPSLIIKIIEVIVKIIKSCRLTKLNLQQIFAVFNNDLVDAPFKAKESFFKAPQSKINYKVYVNSCMVDLPSKIQKIC